MNIKLKKHNLFELENVSNIINVLLQIYQFILA